jgi:D-arabinose 1-dehydrogenase-like Zn-dependent alcohol dehydrogenase
LFGIYLSQHQTKIKIHDTSKRLCRAKHGITSDVEVINIDYINEAYERMIKGDVRYRFVIDMASL